MSRKYNYIHQKIVNDDADVLGAIAYSIYKKEKQLFIEKFKAKNGKDPEEDDIAKFHEIISTDSNIERFRMQAGGILQDFVNSTLSDTIHDIEEVCNENHLEQIGKAIAPLKPESKGKRFWGGVLQSVVGAVAFAVLVALVLFVVSLSKTQYSFTIGGKGDISMETVKCDTRENSRASL